MAVGALTGERVAYVAEVDAAASAVLRLRFPDAPNIGDITAYDWTTLVGQVDIITAGFPCQDISNAGKREGIDGKRSGIYTHVIDAVRILRPRLVFLENVAAIRSRGLWQVVADLAEIGYDARWTCVRASDVGAAHHRDRWFLVAFPANTDRTRLEVRSVEPARDEQPPPVGGGASSEPDCPTCGCGEWMHDAGGFCAGCHGCTDPELGRTGEVPEDPHGAARTERRGAAPGQAHEGGHGPTLDDEVSFLLPHADGERRDGGTGDESTQEGRGEPADGRYSPAEWWGDYLPAIRRWEDVLGRPAPEPTEIGPRGGRRLAAPFAEWLMGIPAGHVTDVPDLTRAKQLHIIGNGVVPQQAYEAYRRLLSHEALTEESTHGQEPTH